jgi:hypothetical protein
VALVTDTSAGIIIGKISGINEKNEDMVGEAAEPAGLLGQSESWQGVLLVG